MNLSRCYYLVSSYFALLQGISLSNLSCTQFITFLLFHKKTMFLWNYIADKKYICECISTGIALPNSHNKTIKLETILYPALVH